MGHREALLSAARRCLIERGYARTTARDLVAESGTNLASIGYHFGSKDALLVLALDEAFTEYTNKVAALAESLSDREHPLERMRQAWVATAEAFPELRPLMAAFLEAMAQAEHNDQLRRRLAETYEHQRNVVARSVDDAVAGLDPEIGRAVASFTIAVCDGLLIQWMLDPERAPSGGALFDTALAIFSLANEPT
jgi:AcrR family transcriptional regulator